ncbi:P-loop containing nucleoside triphosphate hydrolase protein [Phakopsora pachyrhizi]|uniref:Vesicular-fusion protein SEC18 n=1 Tax=Phakopsora pachyrhizi TaxID=170000 RepID=A0AAV0BJE1_PHAPC|nr:P-loop containing nucleoside triphosphate hydrolase protein [Phakopsora pachyrhizi]
MSRLPPSGMRSSAGLRNSSRSSGSNSGFKVVECPNMQLAFSNCLIVSSQDLGSSPYVTVKGRYVFTTKSDKAIMPGTVGAMKAQRAWAQLSTMGDVVDIVPFDPQRELGANCYLGELDLEVGWWHQGSSTPGSVFDADEMSKLITRSFDSLIFSIGQPLVFEMNGEKLRAIVTATRTVDVQALADISDGPREAQMGILMSNTVINVMKAPDAPLKIKASAKRAAPNSIIKPNFKFQDMGIGGLDSEFGAIFRRAFASRIFPPGMVEKLGIQHVKGLLLFGPPGTGKTLMARQIGKMLNAREPKIVNGPEILNKFVGESEKNIRELFAEAEKEYKAKGDESGLHIIIFDELDAICKQRGSTGGGTGVGDSVVNQLLSKMDGVDQLNNILIIGMTNRLDMIDEALLRPGRLEVHMEISLPDEKGRLQILNIHTSKMRTNNVMANDVKLEELAALTKNFSGAELSGLVKSATSFAFNRHIKVGTTAGVGDDLDQMQVNIDDFLNALDEVKPAFGVAEEELKSVVQNGIIKFSPEIDEILHDGKLFVEQVRTSTRTPLVSVLIYGPPGSGKTALAASIAQASDFPFIKLISPENMVGFSEAQKINYLYKVFSDSYKSPLSVIVVDNIERILDWVPIGPRFSNGVLQALIVLLGKRPPKDKRLLVLATSSSRSMLQEMGISETFASEIRVPPIDTLKSLELVISAVKLFPDKQSHQRAISLLEQAGFREEGRLAVGVKKLINISEMCRQDEDRAADKLVMELMGLGS